jgi:hypothetical protein
MRFLKSLVCIYQYSVSWANFKYMKQCQQYATIQNVPGGNIKILGGHSIGHSKQKKKKNCICTCVLFRNVSEISLYSSLDLAHSIILPSRMWISVKRQLAVVTVDSDIVGVLRKMPHIFTNVVYADMLSSHDFQNASMWNFRKCIIPGKLYQLCHLWN